MAEYIEREALIAEIQKNIHTYWNEGSGGYYLAEDALNYSVKTAPTADVVPKTEIAKIFEEIENAINLNLLVIENMLNEKGGRANGKTVLLAKYEVFTELKKFLAELKRKYTENENG